MYSVHSASFNVTDDSPNVAPVADKFNVLPSPLHAAALNVSVASPVSAIAGVSAEPLSEPPPNLAQPFAAYPLIQSQPVKLKLLLAISPLHLLSLPPVPSQASNVSENMLVNSPSAAVAYTAYKMCSSAVRVKSAPGS